MSRREAKFPGMSVGCGSSGGPHVDSHIVFTVKLILASGDREVGLDGAFHAVR